MKKGILLIFALLLPVLIFLFLRFFGRNEFEVPVFYQSSLDEVPSDCDVSYNFPYRVVDSQVPLETTAVIFFSDGLDTDQLMESRFQLSRLHNELKGSLNVFFVSQEPAAHEDEGQIALDSARYFFESKCLLLAGSNRVVLVDDNKQIRGYYKDASLKEIDRLILELKILFNEY